MSGSRQWGVEEVRTPLHWTCHDCHHLTYCGDGITCGWCGSQRTASGSGTAWGEGRSRNSKGMGPELDVVSLTNNRIPFRLARGFALLRRGGHCE